MMLNTALILHVIIGLIGVGASYAVALGFFKRKLEVNFLLWASGVAVVAYVLSYFFGGYYFDAAYKVTIEHTIREGARPWADLFFMEAKGRLFLFLPFLAFTLLAVIYAYRDELAEDPVFRRHISQVAFLTFTIGVFVALAGLVVSGAAM